MRQIVATLNALVLAAAAGGCSLFPGHAKLNYRTVAADPNHDTQTARKLNDTAVKLYQKGKLDKAEQSLQKALIADVTYGPAHNNLGNLYFSQGNHYLAAWEFEYAIKLMPQRPEPHNNLGLVYETVGKIEEAIEAYECARNLQPNNAEFIGNLARARIRRGDPVAAVRPLLSDLAFLDTRPAWVGWAKEQLALCTTPSAPPAIEMLPAPPGLPPTDYPKETDPVQPHLEVPRQSVPPDRSTQSIPVGSPQEAGAPRS